LVASAAAPSNRPLIGPSAKNAKLPAHLRFYNGRRNLMALGGLAPKQRLAEQLT
jgi:hypothetical protein